jgi:hypothetical protein
MAKVRTKVGLITLEYDSKEESIETEYNGIDRWTFKIIQLQPAVQSTLAPFDSLVDSEIKKKPISAENKELENITSESIAEYIKTKPHFEHDTIELQDQFLKRRVIARQEKKLYSALDWLIREARNIIAKEYKGTWEASATRKSYGGRNYANVYRFKRTPEQIIEEAMKSAVPASQIEAV